MKIRSLLIAFGAGCAMTMLATNALSLQNEGGMPDEAEMERMWMEALAKYGTPSAEHAELALSAGEWNSEVKMWHVPDMEPEVMHGTASSKMIMDGRYLLENFSSDWEGMPFEGASLTAYDRMKQKYVSIWIDNMSTGVMISEGTAKGDVSEMKGMMPDFILGKEIPVRTTIEHISGDQYVVKMHRKDDAGKEFVMMEITYTRAAGNPVHEHDHDHDHGRHEDRNQ